MIVMVALATLAQAGFAQQPAPDVDAAADQASMAAALADKKLALAEAEKKLAKAAREVAELSQSVNERVFVFDSKEFALNDTPMLGVTLSSSSVSKRLNGQDVVVEFEEAPGVMIVGVGKDTGAEKAGLKQGDRLVSVDGVSLLGESDGVPIALISEALDDRKPGDVVTVEFVRDGKTLAEKVALTARRSRGLLAGANGFAFQTPGEDGIVSVQRGFFDRLERPHAPGMDGFQVFSSSNGNSFFLGAGRRWSDMELVELSPSLGAYFGADSGLLVVRAPEDDALGFADGDVIRKIGDRAPESVGHAMRILSSYEPGEQMTVQILRERKKRTLDITLPE